jgi:hypothetical protein
MSLFQVPAAVVNNINRNVATSQCISQDSQAHALQPLEQTVLFDISMVPAAEIKINAGWRIVGG